VSESDTDTTEHTITVIIERGDAPQPVTRAVLLAGLYLAGHLEADRAHPPASPLSYGVAVELNAFGWTIGFHGMGSEWPDTIADHRFTPQELETVVRIACHFVDGPDPLYALPGRKEDA
jgi:hypothetical protein